MKKKSQIFITIALILLTLTLVGCDFLEYMLDYGTVWTFDNYSNYSITISDINGSPSTISLQPWRTATTTVYNDSIVYTYSPSNYVYSSRVSGENKIKFFAK